MMNRITKHLSNQRGVTLIELIAVIMILGIIAVVAIPAVFSQIQNAEIQADNSNLQIMSDAIERYATVNGSYPSVSGADNTARAGSLITLLKSTSDGGPYLNQFPTSPEEDGKHWEYDNAGNFTKQ